LHLQLLGRFEAVVDGETVPPSAWSRRHAAALVKAVALADGRRLHREQLLELLWAGVEPAVAAPRLHKAAHYARKALGAGALHTGNEMMWLDGSAGVDVVEFSAIARRAVREGSQELAAEAVTHYGGTLLPDDLFEPWTEAARDEARLLYMDCLRIAGQWDAVLREESADEQAHLALIRAAAGKGDLRGALRQFQRMEQALQRELGAVPSAEAQRMRARLESAMAGGAAPAAAGSVPRTAAAKRRPLVGRRDVAAVLREHLARAAQGRGGVVLVSGPPGVGKTAVLDLAVDLAEQRGFRTGRGIASAVEGQWPYAPVLEAFSDIGRKHPALLDGLDDGYRRELDRALAGRDMEWSGESSHQRLFVAAAEMLRLAAAGHGLLFVVDDIHDSDNASLRLLHYLARCAVGEPVLVAAAHRPTSVPAFNEIADSLIARGAGTRVSLTPLSEADALQLLSDQFPDLPADIARRIWTVSGGLPFAILEQARAHGTKAPVTVAALTGAARTTLQRVALLGATFTADEFLACAQVGEDAAYRQLEQALDALVVEPTRPGYRFRHPLVRESLLQALPSHEEPAARRAAGEALVQTNAPPGRVARQFLNAGLPSRAVPYALRAVETAGALGAYRDALDLIEAVRPHAGPDELPTLLARRGDLLLALGDPEAVAVYQEAMALTTGTQHRLVRARLARAASFTEDIETARAAITGLELEGDAADSSILRAQAVVAYFSGDIDGAWTIAGRARELLQSPEDPWHVIDLVGLQGMIAHRRGELFERFRLEMRRTSGRQRLAEVLFDAHLCAVEFMLYGRVPYAEVIRDAEELRDAAAEAGALRGTAFATALIGEAALLMDDLERAERELLEAVDLHRELAAPAGEAHGLHRLAEVKLAQGDRQEARELVQRALPLARWSATSPHLLQRIYGTMIAAADDKADARAVVDMAEATMGETDRCFMCTVMFAVPATIACAEVGDLDAARAYLAAAEASAARWEGTSWTAAVDEARAHLADADGRAADAVEYFVRAERLYAAADHRRAAARCAAAAVADKPPAYQQATFE
jgi:DNA-binding SARP family transcriptional activator/tetratricopeptide (TPR) repeat protein